MQVLLFTLVAIALYFFADWLLRAIESRRGAPLPNRSLVFFVIIMLLALVTFEVLQQYLQQASTGT